MSAAPSVAIVLLDHGSRRPEANAQLAELALRVAERRPDAQVRIAHLEVTEPNLLQAVDECVATGATEIIIHPFFLAPGRHTTEDIPNQAAQARTRHPGVRIVTSAPLGLSDEMVNIVLERIDEAGRVSPKHPGDEASHSS